MKKLGKIIIAVLCVSVLFSTCAYADADTDLKISTDNITQRAYSKEAVTDILVIILPIMSL